MKEESRIWKQVVELSDYVDEMSANESDFVLNLVNNLDPFNPYEEINENQVKYIQFLYERICQNRDDLTWKQYTEELEGD